MLFVVMLFVVMLWWFSFACMRLCRSNLKSKTSSNLSKLKVDMSKYGNSPSNSPATTPPDLEVGGGGGSGSSGGADNGGGGTSVIAPASDRARVAFSEMTSVGPSSH